MDSHSVMWWVIGSLMVFGLMRVVGPRGGRRYRPRIGGHTWRGEDPDRDTELDPALRPQALLRELDAQRNQMEEMASRLSELENRADFAERLLAGPREKQDAPR